MKQSSKRAIDDLVSWVDRHMPLHARAVKEAADRFTVEVNKLEKENNEALFTQSRQIAKDQIESLGLGEL